MSSLILDAGAFVAVERNDRTMMARLRRAQQENIDLRTNGAVVAQVWREPSGRQAILARLLASVEVRVVDRELGQRAGVMSGQAGRGDAVDATLVAVAESGDRIVTGDPDDIKALVEASGRAVLVLAC